jgi:rRNA-processing protein FCF1
MLHSLVQKYRRKGILIDANLLIVLLVGKLGPAHLINCRATKSFTPDDFSLLERFVMQFNTLVTTPHILTEVSNLAERLPEGLLDRFRTMFREVIKSLSEQPRPAMEIAWDAAFLRFGLTDTAIAMVVPRRYLVLTADLPLCGLLQRRKIDVINFNHIRTLGWT